MWLSTPTVKAEFVGNEIASPELLLVAVWVPSKSFVQEVR